MMLAEKNIQMKLDKANRLLFQIRRDYKLKKFRKLLTNCRQILILLEKSYPNPQKTKTYEVKILEILFTTWLWMARAYHKLGDEMSSQKCYHQQKNFVLKFYETQAAPNSIH